MAAAHSSRGAAFGDYDDDGDLDILVVNMNEPPSLLRNDYSGSGGWLTVALRGEPGRSNRDAIGARAVLRYGNLVQARAVTAQSSFYSVDDSRLHFGLGSAERADLTVHWPLPASSSESKAWRPDGGMLLRKAGELFRDASRGSS